MEKIDFLKKKKCLKKKLMSAKKSLDYDILADPENPDFITELKRATRVLSTKSASKFYSTVLQHFSGNLEKETGNEILLTLCMLMQSKGFVKQFTAENFILQLPFERSYCREQLLDLLYFLVKADPNALIPDVAPKFAVVLEKRPGKSLTLLAMLALKFERIQDPWLIFELLVKRPQYFADEDLIGNYVALLIYLNKNYEPFRKAYSTRTWKSLCSFLPGQTVNMVKTTICGLCALYDIIPKAAAKGGFPTREIAKYLKKADTRSAAIPLLLRTQPKNAAPEDLRLLIANLIKVAREDKKATLIMMDMATDERVAQIMVESPMWIGYELPTTIETVRLFAVVLSHKKLREQIMQTDVVINLFRNMIEQEDPLICSIICTFIRRLPITSAFVTSLGKQGLIKSYIELFLKSTEDNVIMSGLLFVDTISVKAYHKDYVHLIDNLKQMLKNQNISKTAAAVAANLAKHQELHATFKERGLVKFFQNALKDENIKKQAKKFLKNMESGD
jgi:hypothetical protein